MSRRQEMAVALTVAAALVLFRSIVFIAYEHAFFDSDQAIVGLMAKHLVEGRAFPLFYYGQTYMLVVDAWVAAPFFLVVGPTVAALHGATTALNAVAAALLVIVLTRRDGMRPLVTLIPVSFFALASPMLGRSLIEAGANIGPLVYVPLLWLLRRRPMWFGLVLGIGILNREFTVYVVPVLLLGELWTRSLWQPARIGHIQLADNPGRGEPGTGEINYPWLFKHIDQIGYTGWIGCEYKPRGTTTEGLGWRDALTK